MQLFLGRVTLKNVLNLLRQNHDSELRFDLKLILSLQNNGKGEFSFLRPVLHNLYYVDIRDIVGVAPIEEKLVQHRLRWFGHIQRRPPEAPVHSGRLKCAENVKRGRGIPNLTWEESVKRDLKDWSITKELAIDRGAWKLAIHVPEP